MDPLIVDILKIAAPVLLGAVVWAVQTLAQRAWDEFEMRRDLYVEVIANVDSLFGGSSRESIAVHLRNIRKVWLVGTDDVVRAANRLSTSIQSGTQTERNAAYSEFINTMRRDLRKRRWLPPSKTDLGASDFPIQAAS